MYQCLDERPPGWHTATIAHIRKKRLSEHIIFSFMPGLSFVKLHLLWL